MTLNFLKLGIVWQNGKIKNHRSLLKVVLNPFLAKFFGGMIGTRCNEAETKLGRLQWVECWGTQGKKALWESVREHWVYDVWESSGDYDRVEFRRWFC